MPARLIAPLKVIDLIIVTAAIAMGLGLLHAAEPGRSLFRFVPVNGWIEKTAPLVSVGMIAVLGLRLVRPRPPFWRLARQPGILACTMALASFGLIVIHALAYPLRSGRLTFQWNGSWSPLTVILGRGTADGIFAGRLTLAITGQWRPRPEWFDRAGIVLGAYLIMMFRIAPLVAYYELVF